METWIVMHCMENYDGDFDESVEGIFHGTQDEVIDYVNKRNEECSVGFYTYHLGENLN